MKFHGEATLAMKEPSGHLSRKITVSGVGASTASTALYCSWRLDMTPGGGKMILSYEAFTSLDGQQAAVVELHAMADLERIGALVGGDGPRLGDVADELGARLVRGIHAHERAVVGTDGVEHPERLFPVSVEARRLRGPHEDQLAPGARLVLGGSRMGREERGRKGEAGEDPH